MGLDMYLYKQIYVGAKFDHRHVAGTIDITVKGERIPIQLKRVSRVVEEVAYWRKANAIHAWFVKNVQSGEDDCKEHDVSLKQLKELLDIVNRVLKDKDPLVAEELLPTQEGFFFGSTEFDQWYWEDLEYTSKVLTEILEECEKERKNPESISMDFWFTYDSSW